MATVGMAMAYLDTNSPLLDYTCSNQNSLGDKMSLISCDTYLHVYRVSGSEVAEPAPQDLPDDAPDVKVTAAPATPLCQ